MEKKVEIFFCYAREDDLLLKQLKTHLRPLQRQGFIDVWHDRDIDAGTDWEQEISKHLNTYNIAVKLQGTFSPRPLSFDLFQSILDDIGARVTSVIISDLIDEVYYAIVRVKIGGREAEFDARPADALALAIYCYAPVFVEKRVMEIAGVRPDLGTSKD